MLGRIKTMPIVRLEGGKHVKPMENGEVQAYLPADRDTGFPTVARAVYADELARQFLIWLGLTYPDLVDDVMINVLPKYRDGQVQVTNDEYGSDMERILNAHGDATYTQANRLIAELKTAKFVRTTDAQNLDDVHWHMPDNVYAHDGNMSKLFSGVKGIRLTDSSLEPAITRNIHALMDACGVSDKLRPAEFDNESFTWNQRQEMRNGDTFTRELGVEDKRLLGLKPLLATLPDLEPEARIDKAKLLWQELSRLNNFDFLGSYRWFYFRERSRTFDAEFVETLNAAAWIPDASGNLKRPSETDFESLGWTPNEFLQTKIRFRPPFNRARAMDAGVEEFQLDMLDLLNEQGITDMAVLRRRLRIRDRTVPSPTSPPDTSQNGQTQPTPTRRDRRQNQPAPTTATFAESLVANMTTTPSRPRTSAFAPPPGGPKTDDSARADVDATVRDGGSGAYEPRIATEWQPAEAASELAQKFRDMTRADYGSRCQICSRSFRQRNGASQGFVVHLVQISEDSRANNFGDLLGLCGWHYALIRYGQWTLLDNDRNPINDAAQLRPSIEERHPRHRRRRQQPTSQSQSASITCTMIGIAEPQTIDAQIRYSIPHWKYLKALLEA